jgi:hypothetical protein
VVRDRLAAARPATARCCSTRRAPGRPLRATPRACPTAITVRPASSPLAAATFSATPPHRHIGEPNARLGLPVRQRERRAARVEPHLRAELPVLPAVAQRVTDRVPHRRRRRQCPRMEPVREHAPSAPGDLVQSLRTRHQEPFHRPRQPLVARRLDQKVQMVSLYRRMNEPHRLRLVHPLRRQAQRRPNGLVHHLRPQPRHIRHHSRRHQDRVLRVHALPRPVRHLPPLRHPLPPGPTSLPAPRPELQLTLPPHHVHIRCPVVTGNHNLRLGFETYWAHVHAPTPRRWEARPPLDESQTRLSRHCNPAFPGRSPRPVVSSACRTHSPPSPAPTSSTSTSHHVRSSRRRPLPGLRNQVLSLRGPTESPRVHTRAGQPIETPRRCAAAADPQGLGSRLGGVA